MLSVEDYRASLRAQVRAPRAIELPTADARALLGLVTAAPVRARIALPPFTNSAMDGYAVVAADLPGTLPVLGDIPAGDTRALRLDPGSAWRIMTGAPVPEGADAVVQVELTDGGTSRVRIDSAVEVGAAIRAAGTDVQTGTEIIPTGTRLDARHLPVIISAGVETVSVFPRPRVAVVSTGDELRSGAGPLEHGQIFDSNGPMLAALAEQAGYEVVDVTHVGDTGEEVRTVLAELAGRCDAIVTSGGVSAGAFEPLKLAFASEFTFSKVAMQPGKPQGFGLLGDTAVFALPGNPVSSLVSFHVFVDPVLRVLAGRVPPRRLSGQVQQGWRASEGREQYARVTFDGNIIQPAGGQGSHIMGGLVGANALAIVPADITDVQPGQILEVISLEPSDG